MRKIISKSLIAAMAVFSILMLAEVGNAQQPNWARNRRYTRVSVDRMISNVENRVDRFVSQFDNALDNSRLDGSKREDNLNQSAKNLESATDELRSEFNRRGDNWWETQGNVQRCVTIARNINTAMRRRRFNRQTENNWRNVRQELNALARAYNVSQIGSYR